MLHEPKKLLLDLGLTESEVTVYLAMLSGFTSAKEIMKSVRLKRPTLYYALSSLEKRGLINKNGKESGKMFSVEPVEKILSVAEQKVLEMLDIKKNLEMVLPSLTNTISSTPEKPAVAFYEGIDAVKNTIMAMLYCKHKTIQAIVPKENFFWQVGEDFVRRFVTQRASRSIKTKNLWEVPSTKKVMREFYQSSEVRIFPKEIVNQFETTIFIYDNKTLYVSSKKNAYCILITSKEHTDMMRALFNGIWSIAKNHER